MYIKQKIRKDSGKVNILVDLRRETPLLESLKPVDPVPVVVVAVGLMPNVDPVPVVVPVVVDVGVVEVGVVGVVPVIPVVGDVVGVVDVVVVVLL